MPEGVSLSRAPAGPTRTELDLRGMRVEEAEAEIDTFLDQALMKGLSSVRIVHGGGTGALRSLVRERLKGHPVVRALRPESVGLTDGATQVELV
jgi:DNA mismatch repair protein MutS2